MSLKSRKRKMSSSPRKNPRPKQASVAGVAARLATRPPAPTAAVSASLGTVPAGDQACVWMRAGVIKFRLCDRELDCAHCMLDAALQGRGANAPWTAGDWGPSGYRLFPHDRQFSPAHAWVQPLSGRTVRTGVDALATWLMSDIVGVQLPEVGASIKRGEPLATFVAKAGEISVPAPVPGLVRARNELVVGCPELVTAAPYGAGWVAEIELPKAEQGERLPGLLSGPDAESLSRGQLHRFHQRVDVLLAERTPRIGPTLADGGEPVSDPCVMLGPAAYLKLVQEIFR
jgi:glycine cleavage system H protein